MIYIRNIIKLIKHVLKTIIEFENSVKEWQLFCEKSKINK